MKYDSIDWNHPTIGQPESPIAASAWIDPLGKFYAVPDCGHSQWAEEYYGVAESTLEARGWLHVSFGNIMKERACRQSQIDTLWDVLETYVATGYGYAERFRDSLMAIMGDDNS